MEAARVGIIGAGPLGIELAVALKRAGIDYIQFDAKQIGSTISWFPPQTRFFSSSERIAIAGVPLQTPDQGKATREQYLAYLRSVVRQFDLNVHTYELVTGIERLDGGFVLTTQRRQCRVEKLVLATGGTAVPRRLGIPGDDLPHVHRYWTDPHDYFDKNVHIVGGKNGAVETALRLHSAGARISLSYRREQLPEKSIKYWLLPEINGLIKSGAIAAHFGTTPVEITPGHVRLSGGAIIPADFVIMQIGYLADMTLCRLAGVELGEHEAPRFNPATMETNVPGVYVLGTVTGGTQDRFTVFIENCHVQVDRIMAHVTGKAASVAATAYANPES